MAIMGRPKDYAWIMPEHWKVQVLERLEELGWTQKYLAELVGLTPAAITHCLSPIDQGGYKASKAAPKIAEVTGVQLPGAATDPDIARGSEMMTRLKSLSPVIFGEVMSRLKQAHDSQVALLKRVRTQRNRK